VRGKKSLARADWSRSHDGKFSFDDEEEEEEEEEEELDVKMEVTKTKMENGVSTTTRRQWMALKRIFSPMGNMIYERRR
jgi:hypothetical protein